MHHRNVIVNEGEMAIKNSQCNVKEKIWKMCETNNKETEENCKKNPNNYVIV